MKQVKGSKLRNRNNNRAVDKQVSDRKIEKVKSSKIRKSSFNSFANDEKALEKEATQEENMSILGICLIVIMCFVVGITLGICLYRLAINNSGTALIINKVILKLFE